MKITSASYIIDGYDGIPRKNIIFNKSIINKLELNGEFSILTFYNTKVRDFYSANVDFVDNKLVFLNSSFETPLNFPEMKLSDSAYFEMQNTNFEAYMKFQWDEINGKIFIDKSKNKLKSYRNVYNLLNLSYKTLSLIKDADECYFTWKQFERKNYWRMFWEQESSHWYNPLDFFKALGYSLFNNINYYSCGYGVKPLWVLPFTTFIVLVFALIYFFMPTPISSLEQHLVSRDKISNKLENKSIEDIKNIFSQYDFNFDQHKQGLIEDIVSSLSATELLQKLGLIAKNRYNLGFFWHCVYFSFSTFTTIGIGDWYPSGKWNKALVMIEGALGWLCLGLFITTYANILLR